jgi:PilZ domain
MKPGFALERLQERRTSVRYPLSVPVIFSWGKLEKHIGEGFTKGVSLSGTFVLTKECPPEAVEVKLDLTLPTWGDPDSKIILQCVGRVVRIVTQKESDKAIGFAMAGSFPDQDTFSSTLIDKPFLR